MEDKNYRIEKENTMNIFSEKHDYEKEKQAEEETHTDKSINEKNTESHRYRPD